MTPLIVTYPPQAAADLLGLPKATILAAVSSGELPVIRYNRRVYRITATDCALWFATKGGRLKSTPTTPTTPPGDLLPGA